MASVVLASFGSVDGILRLLNTPEVPREPTKERTAASEGNAKGHGGSGASGRLLPVHTQRGEGKMIHAPQSRVTASRILTTPTKGLRTACAFAYGVVAHSRRLCSLDMCTMCSRRVRAPSVQRVCKRAPSRGVVNAGAVLSDQVYTQPAGPCLFWSCLGRSVHCGRGDNLNQPQLGGPPSNIRKCTMAR